MVLEVVSKHRAKLYYQMIVSPVESPFNATYTGFGSEQNFQFF